MTTWTASFIASDDDLGSAPILRREFTLDAGHGDVTAATLDVSALGVVEAWLGGTRVSDHLLEPGWTSYEWRVRVVSHDVTAHLTATEPGTAAVLALVIGNGWAAGGSPGVAGAAGTPTSVPGSPSSASPSRTATSSTSGPTPTGRRCRARSPPTSSTTARTSTPGSATARS